MMGLSQTALANGELASALIVGLLLSGPAGSITAGAPGAGSGPTVSGARTGRPYWHRPVGTMTHTILVLAGVLMLLGVGVLIGPVCTRAALTGSTGRLVQRVRTPQRARDGTGQEALPHRNLRVVPRGVDADVAP